MRRPGEIKINPWQVFKKAWQKKPMANKIALVVLSFICLAAFAGIVAYGLMSQGMGS